MAIITGGIIEEWGPAKSALLAVMREVRQFAPRTDDNDYAVDIAFRSWHNFREPEFTGVQPGMIGRKQRRFVVWHSVPQGLDTKESVRSWLATALTDTARLTRDLLPSKAGAYPTEDLASELDALRASLAAVA